MPAYIRTINVCTNSYRNVYSFEAQLLHRKNAVLKGLTPAHFLIGGELSRLQSLSAGIYRRDDTPSGVNHLIRRWQYQQCLTAQLWKRWKREYVTTLTTRGRWRKTHQEPRVGDIVLVHEPSTA
ncbi:conserved hypothetical protein [Trichinella spiralis]|uniref:hypothetical protein n=1 Tax=Trichinella spiralis TaxID=6334 RepID=UPI0001EFD21D|nr:conserved hypothetical protein [Trichinella spiralis]XP_003368044.1 conserved hypothetical protein [Trichinella spiralis]